jgi:hypothetical protein
VLKTALAAPSATGNLTWTNDQGAQLGFVTFAVGAIDEAGTRPLILRFSDDLFEPKQAIALEMVTVGFSKRWYARCPDCARTARKLYLVPEQRFVCRRCARVEYRSTQTHDARVDFCRRDPRSFLRERKLLQSLHSKCVSLSLIAEAERRGIQWISPAEMHSLLMDDAEPEEREILESVPTLDPR